MNLEIANRLLALRREHGYSQEELAYKLGSAARRCPSGRGRSPLQTRTTCSPWPGSTACPRTRCCSTPRRGGGPGRAGAGGGPGGRGRGDFAAARAWDAAEEAEQKARKRARAKWKEGLLWLLTLALMVILPNLTYWLGISEVYAVVVTVAFLITGFLLDNWHPGWMLFLTIPLYYVLIFGR